MYTPKWPHTFIKIIHIAMALVSHNTLMKVWAFICVGIKWTKYNITDKHKQMMQKLKTHTYPYIIITDLYMDKSTS